LFLNAVVVGQVHSESSHQMTVVRMSVSAAVGVDSICARPLSSFASSRFAFAGELASGLWGRGFLTATWMGLRLSAGEEDVGVAIG
jgi:hypothetical protein